MKKSRQIKLAQIEQRIKDLEDFLEVSKWLKRKMPLPMCFCGLINCKKSHFITN